MTKVLLIIGTVWPEPRSSAAGLRDRNLIDLFLTDGWKVHYASPSRTGLFREEIERLGCITHSVQANDSTFDQWVRDLGPTVVIFDRFIMEEQFGWRVAENVPDALRILDTQDLHCLRRARQAWIAEGLPQVMVDSASGPLEGPDLYRELASILRSDLTLILSDFEWDLLTQRLGVDASRLALFRFLYPRPQPLRAFEDREHLAMIGNFRHPPNWDATQWFLSRVWKGIRGENPQLEVHVYGAYPPTEAMQWNRPQEGIRVFGPCPDQFETLSRYRLSLAPLRFGAGIKGKISDSWWVGTPVLSTPIGSEGMTSGMAFGGRVIRSEDGWANEVRKIYYDKDSWLDAQVQAQALIRAQYSFEQAGPHLLERVRALVLRRDEVRSQNLLGKILHHHTLHSSRYLSKWIEEKNSR